MQQLYSYKTLLFIVVFVVSISTFGQTEKFKFQHLNVNNGLPQNSVYAITKDKYGYVWFGTWGGVARFNGYDVKTFRPIENDTTALTDYRISAIVNDANEHIWVETENKDYYFKYNFEQENFTRYLKNKAPQTVLNALKNWRSNVYREAKNEKFKWNGGANGLLQTNLSTSQVIQYKKEINNPFSLSGNQASYVYLDNQENLWVGTQSGGVNYTNIYNKPFTNYFMGQKGEGLIDNVVRVISKDNKGRIWIGSENRGITIIDKNKNTPLYQYLDGDLLGDLKIRALCNDQDGNMWIGTKNGLFIYADSTVVVPPYNRNFYSGNIFSLFQDHKKNMWIGTLYGLVLYDYKSEEFTQVLQHNKSIGKYIRSIKEDKNHHLWVATEDLGISQLIPNNSKLKNEAYTVKHYNHQKENINSLPSNRTYSLTIDSLGMVWVATDAGLCRLNPKTEKVITFDVDNGLPDNMVMGVLFDGEESVWVSHKKGLTKIDISSFKLQNFNIQDGLQGNEFSQNACYIDKDSGEMFFGGTNGLNAFFPTKIKTNPHPPEIVLTDLSVMHQKVKIGQEINGTVVLEQSLLCTKEINLTWENRIFEIEFAALHYANSEGNKYKYKLEGFDKNWINTNASNRKAAYTNLSPGVYVFKVMAANSDGVWNPTPKSLKINIIAPWWRSTLAILVYVLLFVIFIWLIVYYVFSKVRLKQKEAIHTAKLQFFTEISHEFRTPLTLIVDPLEKLISEKLPAETVKQYYKLMHRNAKQLLLLIHQLLDFRKLETGHFSLSLKTMDFISFIRTMVASFKTQADEKSIELEFVSAIQEVVFGFDEHKLNIILNNLLSNAIKFTSAKGRVEVSVYFKNEDKEFVCFQVKDTGIGIAKDELQQVFELFYQTKGGKNQNQGSGIGLSLTKELVLLHEGSIQVESQLNKGTIFTVSLPVKNIVQEINLEHTIEENTQEDDILSIKNTSDLKKRNLPILLFVDDNQEIRDYIHLSFKHQFKVITAKHGVEGIALAIEHIPDIVISDVMMPEMDGLAFCKRLKTNKITSHIPVILLTSQQSDKDKTTGYETGADSYVIKPFTSSVLYARIQNLLKQRELLRALFAKGSVEELKKIANNSADTLFLEEVSQLIEMYLGDAVFNVDFLAEKMGMSRSQFYRKIKALTNKSVNDFITTFQMNKAVEYLLSGAYNISETAYKVGYSAPNSFTRAFAKYFGMSPSQYLESHK
ncbi:hybrid sensor histidine kinase/response regulator transcription factor [Wenyingzhuangia sp. IMCC45467]